MKLDLDRSPRGRSVVAVGGDLELEWQADRPGAIHVSGDLTVDNMEGRVLAAGTLNASGDAVCTRCLVGFAMSWPVDVSCMVLRDPGNDEGEDDSMVVHQRDGEVDLREILRESAILAFPQQTLCRENCAGLCAGCGRNLNNEGCVCEAPSHDPRWDALDMDDPENLDDPEDKESK